MREQAAGPGVIGDENFDWSTMWSYAFGTFLTLTIFYAIARVAHRAYTTESEIKSKIKK